MLTPLSISPYNSRFSLDSTFDYINMVYHGFYGGTSLQAQELNELQENIQIQLSAANTLIGNWLEYYNNINIQGESSGIMYTITGLPPDVFTPIDPNNTSDSDTTDSIPENYWYLYKDNYSGYEQFIQLQGGGISHKEYYNKIKRRILSGDDSDWSYFRDTDNDSTLDDNGANRIQLYYPYRSVTVNPIDRNLIDTAQYFSKIQFDGGIQDQHEWNSWGNNTIAIFNGTRIRVNTPPPGPYVSETRPYGDFVKDPADPEVSSPWHNLVYELAYPIYKWGNRSFLFQFPFGGFRNSFVGTSESGTQNEIQNGEEGPIAGYIRLKENYPVGGPQTSDFACPSRWRGMKEAFNALLRGKLTPTNGGYPVISEPSNIVLYLPCFMGYPTYREETCGYWDSLSGTPAQRDAQFYAMLDDYIADLVYIKENGSEDNKGTLYISFDSLANSATPDSIDLYKTIPNVETPSGAAGAALVVFGYKAKNSTVWSAANGGYRSDDLELADHYVRTQLEAAGIIVSGEAIPPSTSRQIQIEGSTGKYYGSTTSTPVTRGNSVFTNFAAVEGTMWTSRSYSAPFSDFTDILRWPSNSFEIVQAFEDGNNRRPANPFNQPLQVQIQDGSQLVIRKCSGMNGLVYSPFYYLHTLNAVIDHIKYVDKTIAEPPNLNRTDIKLDQNNIIVIPTGIFASNLDEPYANNSTQDNTRYYVHPGLNASYEYRPEFRKQTFIDNVNANIGYTGGLWTDANKLYWDTNLRSLSFDAFVENIRTKSKLVSPPLDSFVSGEPLLAEGFTREQTYPYDIISKGILTGIYEEAPAQTAVEAAYAAALSSLNADCAKIIARFPQQPEQRSQIYAVSWFPIAGNVTDWSTSGSNQVTQFSHVKPAVFIKNTYNEVPAAGELAWQPQVIRNQLTMLDINNNLSNTNIKNIIPIRYQGGWLYGTDDVALSGNTYNNSDSVNGSNTIRSNTRHLIWPDNEIVDMRTDWESFLTAIDVNKIDLNGMRIANTRILFDNESTLTSGNFRMNKPYYDALLLDPRSSENKFDVPSLKSQLGTIVWDGTNPSTPFCGPDGCGFNSDYQVWNKSVEKITTAAISEALLTPFKARYGVDARASNWESNITRLGDGYPSEYGHDSYHDDIFGDSANIVLYGWQSVISSGAWRINASDNTRLKRITNTATETPFKWHNNPWNAFMVNVQGVRSVKRGLMDRGLTNTSINAWISAKDYGGAGDLIVGFANTQYYDEMVRHASLTGIEFFAFYNDEFPDPDLPNFPNGPVHKAKRIEQFGVINAILVDINSNDKLGGYTPMTLDDSRVSYNSDYVMSGAPTKDGKYLWRVTPKVSSHNIYLNFNQVPKIGLEIGVWITTITATKPSIIVAA